MDKVGAVMPPMLDERQFANGKAADLAAGDCADALEKMNLGHKNAKPLKHSTQLPLEILPLILSHLSWAVGDLSACCLVSKAWAHFSQPLLYSRLFLRDQQRLIKVFRTLKANPDLAILVRILEIRVFPFSLRAEELERLEGSILLALQQAVNLEALYWTRTGSLTDRIIPFLPTLPRLKTLELSGSSRFYSPHNVAQHLLAPEKTPRLSHFSVLLPDRNVALALADWAMKLGPKLQSFSILSQHTTFITDESLQAAAQHLRGLRRVSLVGNKSVTAAGVQSLLQAAGGKMQELAMESLAVHPSSYHNLARHLQHLESLTLTFPSQNLAPVQDFWQAMSEFVEELPQLKELTLYTTGWNTPRGMQTGSTDDEDADADNHGDDGHAGNSVDSQYGIPDGRATPTPREYRRQELEEHAHTGRPIIREPRLSTPFLRRLTASRGSQLKKLQIHGIVSSMEQVFEITSGCPSVQDLVLHLYEGTPGQLQSALSHLSELQSLHILASLSCDFYMSESDMRNVAAHATLNLRQIGFRNRVWLIERMPVTKTGIAKPDTAIKAAPKSRQVLPRHNKLQYLGAQDDATLLPDGRRLELRRWDMSRGTYPEVLLVVRTCQQNRLHDIDVLLVETARPSGPFVRSMAIEPPP